MALQVYMLTILSPLIVGGVCALLYRRMGGDHLLFWAAGHTALAFGFFVNFHFDWSGGLSPLWYAGMLGVQFFGWTLLFGVLALTGFRLSLAAGMLAAFALSAAADLLVYQENSRAYWLPIGINTLTSLAAAIALAMARRSVFNVVGSLILLVRAGNGVLYILVYEGLAPALSPAIAQTSSLFINLVSGLGLVLVACDDAYRRLREARLAGEETRAVLQAVLDAVPAAIVQKDMELRIIRANNHALLAFMPLAPGRPFLGQRAFERLPADAAARLEALDREVLANPDGGARETEVVWTMPGAAHPSAYLVRKAPLKDAGGRLHGLVSVNVDITRQKQIESELREVNTALQRQAAELEELNVRYSGEREAATTSNKAKSAFLANMSHELRTPLNAVIGFAEMLAGLDERSAGKHREYSQHILEAGQHLLNVINEVLDMSRIEAGKYTLQEEETDLTSIIDSCLTMVRVRAGERQQRLTREIAADVPVTRVDSRAVKQILLNFLSNAMKFTVPGGTIAVRCCREADGWIAVSVSDNGRGIRPENIRHVFEPFWQEDAVFSRRSGGTGLGLSISRKLIELHGGTISIESLPGLGTTASFRLPPSCAVVAAA